MGKNWKGRGGGVRACSGRRRAGRERRAQADTGRGSISILCCSLPCFGLQRRQSTLDGATAGSSLGWAATNLDVAAGREAGWAFEGVEWK